MLNFKENKSLSSTLLIVMMALVFFVAASLFMNLRNPPWGDEGFHTGTANGLMKVNDFYLAVDPKENIKASNMYYVRGKLVSLLTYASFKTLGMNIVYPRIFVLLTSLLTLLLFLIYIRKKLNASNNEIILSSLMYLGAGFVLEDSIYLRFYTFYNFAFLLAFILLWETYQNYLSGKIKWTYIGLALIALIIPTVDDWQKIHFVYLILAVIILKGEKYRPKIIEKCQYIFKHKKIWLILGLAIGILFLPIIPNAADKVLMRLVKIGNRPYAGYYHDYWDNIFGSVRFIFAANILLFLFFKVIKKDSIKWDFYHLLFVSGAISGIMIGLFTPHNHIFYSRYFLLSIMAMSLASGPLILNYFDAKKITSLVLIYLSFNICYTYLNFKFDKSDIGLGFEWIKNHPEVERKSIISDWRYYWHNDFDESQIIVIKDNSDLDQAKKLKAQIESLPYNEFYFLFINEYELKEDLYYFFTNEIRIPWVTISRHIYRTIPHEDVILMHGGGFIKIKKEDLIKGLDTFGTIEYPGRTTWLKSIKNYLKSLVKQ